MTAMPVIPLIPCFHIVGLPLTFEAFSTGNLCLLCREVKLNGHTCMCHVCNKTTSHDADVMCYRCERLVHYNTLDECCKKIRAVEKKNDVRFICTHCLYAQTTGVSVSARAQLERNEKLSDEHLARASLMLSAQFLEKIGGLCAPLAVTYGEKVDKVNYYPPRTRDKPWVQIINTGKDHWVTVFFPIGSSNAKILDSSRSTPISGHTTIQIAMIARSSENFTVGRPPCKQQTNGVDCGLYAIANAVELCNNPEIKYVDYDPRKLRSHWLQCMESGTLSPFPRLNKRAKKVKEQEEFEVISVYCYCRLPKSYDNLIGCEGECKDWYHYCCVGLEDPDTDNDEWYCKKCKP